jgi:hypothetical protein
MGPFLLSICCWFCLIHRTREYQGAHHIQLGEWGQTSSTIILVANQYHCVEIEKNVKMLVSIMGMKNEKLQIEKVLIDVIGLLLLCCCVVLMLL